MKKILFIVIFLISCAALSAQTGTGWTNMRAKYNFRDSININSGWKIGGTLVAPSVAEINHLDGVTSAIQTQINAKLGISDTTLMLSTYITDNETRTAINDTATARLAAAITGVAARDSAGNEGGYTERYVTPTYLRNYTGSGGDLAIKRLRFIVDETANAPVAGDSTVYHSYFVGKDINFYRNGELEWQNFGAVNTNSGFRFTAVDSTIVVKPLFVTGDTIIIDCLEPFAGIDYLVLEANESTLLDSLKAYWKMDDALGSGYAVDALGNVNLTKYNDPTAQEGGKINYSWLFDGTNDWFEKHDTTSLRYLDEFSVSAWVNSSAANSAGVIVGRLGSTTLGFALRVTATEARATIYDPIAREVLSTTDVTDQTWHHLVMTYDTGLTTLYIDGASEGTPITEVINYFGEFSYFRINRVGSLYFGGNIDNVGFWHRALTAGEVLELYNSENAFVEYPW